MRSMTSDVGAVFCACGLERKWSPVNGRCGTCGRWANADRKKAALRRSYVLVKNPQLQRSSEFMAGWNAALKAAAMEAFHDEEAAAILKLKP